MSFRFAAAAKPFGSASSRKHSLLVCTGVIALSLAALVALTEGGTAVPLIGLGSLLGAALAALWAHRRVLASEARLHKAVQESEALDRNNAELRRFAFAVAHDLRAPLVSTAGMLDMARETAGKGNLEDVMRLLDRATSTARRMDGVISGILDLATVDEPAESQLVDLDEVLANSLEDLSPALQDLGFDVRRDASLGLVQGDARHVQQVFDNLIGNAVKYARPALPGQAPVLTIRATRRRRSIQVSIADNGVGIPQERREEVLDGTAASVPSSAPAVRPASGAGLGLGLPLAKLAMEECGGTLGIQTSPMGGAEFVLSFEADPCVIPDKLPKELPSALPNALLADHASFSSRTILTTG